MTRLWIIVINIIVSFSTCHLFSDCHLDPFMSSEESGGTAHMQEFQTLVLPPVPVARPTNNSTNHNPNSASSQGERRTSLTMSTAPARNNHSHHGHAIPHSHGHHALHSVASEPYPTSKPSSSNKGGVRGRVTVVCAEVCILFPISPPISPFPMLILHPCGERPCCRPLFTSLSTVQTPQGQHLSARVFLFSRVSPCQLRCSRDR